MKQTSAIAYVFSVLIVMSVMPTDFASAQGLQNRAYERYHRIASLNHPLRYGMCRVGWWYRSRYDHVLPQWGVRCLR